MNKASKLDFHTHILPCMDDGSRSVEESIRLLEIESENEVDIVLCTPHFYPDGGKIEEFIQRRQVAHEKLRGASLYKENFPKLRKGAEVYLGVDTAEDKDLSLLCIEGTRYILIEMPYDNWDEWVYTAIYKIIDKQGLIPIIAHIERYIPMQRDTEQIFRLMSIGPVLGQMNTRSLFEKQKRSLCHKLIKNNMVHLLGSDAHHATHLKEVKRAYELIAKKHGIHKLKQFYDQGMMILNNEEVTKSEPLFFKRRLGHYF